MNVMKLLPANPPGIIQVRPASCFFVDGAMFLRDNRKSNRKCDFGNQTSSGSCSFYKANQAKICLET